MTIREAEDKSDTSEQIESSAVILYCLDLTKVHQQDYQGQVQLDLDYIISVNSEAVIWIVGTKKDLTPLINQQSIQPFMNTLTQNKQNIVNTMALTSAKENDTKALSDSIFDTVKKKIREDLSTSPAQQGIGNQVDALDGHDWIMTTQPLQY